MQFQNAVAFLAQFLSTILHRREKKTLEEIQVLIKSNEKFEKVWGNVLRSLEGNGRKLLDLSFQGKDLVLEVHYPDQESYKKLEGLVEELKDLKVSGNKTEEGLQGLDILSQDIVEENIEEVFFTKERKKSTDKQVKEITKQQGAFLSPTVCSLNFGDQQRK